jgi:hypothetical protein
MGDFVDASHPEEIKLIIPFGFFDAKHSRLADLALPTDTAKAWIAELRSRQDRSNAI